MLSISIIVKVRGKSVISVFLQVSTMSIEDGRCVLERWSINECFDFYGNASVFRIKKNIYI